ncbi:MAG: hypothetical protein JST38_03255 [Bacteroidetes bacterium]|nr:hypothetical protein [Bacteroidota bacterium]
MAKSNYPELQHGDLPQITKITKLLRLGPKGQGYTYQYVKECLNANNERQNEEILAIARDLVAARERSMAALLQVRAKAAAKKQQRKH